MYNTVLCRLPYAYRMYIVQYIYNNKKNKNKNKNKNTPSFSGFVRLKVPNPPAVRHDMNQHLPGCAYMVISDLVRDQHRTSHSCWPALGVPAVPTPQFSSLIAPVRVIWGVKCRLLRGYAASWSVGVEGAVRIGRLFACVMCRAIFVCLSALFSSFFFPGGGYQRFFLIVWFFLFLKRW